MNDFALVGAGISSLSYRANYKMEEYKHFHFNPTGSKIGAVGGEQNLLLKYTSILDRRATSISARSYCWPRSNTIFSIVRCMNLMDTNERD